MPQAAVSALSPPFFIPAWRDTRLVYQLLIIGDILPRAVSTISRSTDVGINYPSEYSRRRAVNFARLHRETSRTSGVARFAAPTTGRVRTGRPYSFRRFNFPSGKTLDTLLQQARNAFVGMSVAR